MPRKKKLTVELVEHQILENQMLHYLEDKSKVAMLFDLDRLNAVIDALEFYAGASTLQKSMCKDLKELRRLAFPEVDHG